MGTPIMYRFRMGHAVVFSAMFAASIAIASPPQHPVSRDEVIAMMRAIHPGWEHTGDAREIADAISRDAPDRYTAAVETVYAVRESGLRKCAEGDGGKSLGAWQLQGVDRTIACDPRRAAPVWRGMAEDSIERCQANPPGTALAGLVSGSCERGRSIAKSRSELAERIEKETRNGSSK